MPALSMRVHTRSLGREMRRLGSVGARLRRELSWPDLRSGRWFDRSLRAFLAHRATRPRSNGWAELSAAQRALHAEGAIRRTSFEAAVVGTATAAITTEASLALAESEGALAVVAVPVAGLAVASDMIVRSILHVGMACDIAEVYGRRFDPNDAAELVSLCALALLGEGQPVDDALGRNILARTTHADADLAARAIGTRLTGETVVRDALPWVGLLLSAVGSYRITHRLGRFVQRYLVHRQALLKLVDPLWQRRPESEELFLEGLWFVFTADGQLTREEIAVLSGLLRRRGEDSDDLFERFVADEADWLTQLGRFARDDAAARAQFFQGLLLAAAFSGLAKPARSILEHAAQALSCHFDLRELSRLRDYFERGVVPEPGWFSASAQ